MLFPVATYSTEDEQSTPSQVRRWQCVICLGLLISLLYTTHATAHAAVVDTKLNPTLVDGGAIQRVETSPTGKYVVYLADQESDEVFELYSVPTRGGAVKKLNGSLVAGGDVTNFTISPDGKYVVYGADQEVIGRTDYYSVPIGGGAAVKLTPSIVDTEKLNVVFFLLITYDSQWVIFPKGNKDSFDDTALLSVPITGGAAVQLNPPLVAGGRIYCYLSSPYSDRILYVADQETKDKYELYSVPAAGGSAIKLNRQLAAGEAVDPATFFIRA